MKERKEKDRQVCHAFLSLSTKQRTVGTEIRYFLATQAKAGRPEKRARYFLAKKKGKSGTLWHRTGCTALPLSLSA